MKDALKKITLFLEIFAVLFAVFCVLMAAAALVGTCCPVLPYTDAFSRGVNFTLLAFFACTLGFAALSAKKRGVVISNVNAGCALTAVVLFAAVYAVYYFGISKMLTLTAVLPSKVGYDLWLPGSPQLSLTGDTFGEMFIVHFIQYVFSGLTIPAQTFWVTAPILSALLTAVLSTGRGEKISTLRILSKE